MISWWSLTHWGRVTHICVVKLTIIGSDNGLSPGRRQAIIWTNAGILLIGPLGTNFSENLIEILTFSFTKMRLKVSSAKWRPFCLGLNALRPKLAFRAPIYCLGFKIRIVSINVDTGPFWQVGVFMRLVRSYTSHTCLTTLEFSGQQFASQKWLYYHKIVKRSHTHLKHIYWNSHFLFLDVCIWNKNCFCFTNCDF